MRQSLLVTSLILLGLSLACKGNENSFTDGPPNGNPSDATPPDLTCLKVSPLQTKTWNSAVAVAFVVDTCQGVPVTGLSGSDFAVYEDEKAVSVTESQAVVLKKPIENYVSLVMDNSPSVKASGSLDKAVRAAKAFASQLLTENSSQKIKVSVWFFSEKLTLKQAFTRSRDAVSAALESLLADTTGTNTTNLYGTVVDIVKENQQYIAKRQADMRDGVIALGQIVLFTDGSDQAGIASLGSAVTAVGASRDDVITVALGGEVEPDVLKQIGKSGSYIAKSADELEAVFRTAAARATSLQNRVYVLGYCSPKRAGTHTLQIHVKNDAGKSPPIPFDASQFGSGQCSSAIIEGACTGKQCGGPLWCGGCFDNQTCSAEGVCLCSDPRFTGPDCNQCSNPKFTGAACDMCADPKYTGTNCDQCKDPKFTGPTCSACANPLFTGPNCDQCANPKYSYPNCSNCANPKFTGPNCDQCSDPKFTGPNCDQCANAKYTGTNCDKCANSKYSYPNCTSCINPKFTGPNCDQCANPKFTGPNCDQCADPKFTGPNCDQCVNPKYKGPNCDQCADPKYAGPNCDQCVACGKVGDWCTSPTYTPYVPCNAPFVCITKVNGSPKGYCSEPCNLSVPSNMCPNQPSMVNIITCSAYIPPNWTLKPYCAFGCTTNANCPLGLHCVEVIYNMTSLGHYCEPY